MTELPFDFLSALDEELARARDELARRVDRVEALAELRSLALTIAARERRAVSVSDVVSAGGGEQERARVRALMQRAALEEELDQAQEDELAAQLLEPEDGFLQAPDYDEETATWN